MFQGGEMMNDTFMKEKPVLPLILSMSLPVVYLLVNCLELVKAGIGIVLSAKGVWVNNIISVGANKT